MRENDGSDHNSFGRVAVEDVTSGFTYVLGSPETHELQQQLRQGLNRLQHLIRKPPTGVSESQALNEEHWAVGVAWTVVVIATPDFCHSSRGRELMRLRDEVRKRVITIWKERPRAGEAYPWSSSAHIDLPRQLDTRSVDALIKEVSHKITYGEADYSTNRPRGPVGRPGLFVVLSYQRNYVDLDIARLVRDELTRENIASWDYSDSARKEGNYRDEIEAKIKASRVVIILLSHAWLQSEECQLESRRAAELHKRRLWLVCDDSTPPADADRDSCLDFQPNNRATSLQQLFRKIFPSRRNRRSQASGQ